MRPESSQAFALSTIGQGVQTFLRRQIMRGAGLCLLAAFAFALASLGTWNVADPSFSHATSNPVTNAMGYPGAVFADLAMQFFGLAALAALVPLFGWSLNLMRARQVGRLLRRSGAWVASALLSAAVAGCFPAPDTWPLPTGLGGVFGDVVLKIPAFVTGSYPSGAIAILIGAVAGAPALWLMIYAAGLLDGGQEERQANREKPRAKGKSKAKEEFRDDADAEEKDGLAALGAIAHWWLSARAFLRRQLKNRRVRREAAIDDLGDFDDYDAGDMPRAPVLRQAGRIEPGFDGRGFTYEPSLDLPDAPFERWSRTRAAGRRAGGFRRQGRDHQRPPRPGGHALRARAGARHQVEPRHRPCRRHRPLDERDRRRVAVIPGPQRHRHRAAQRQARDGLSARALASRDFEKTKAKLASRSARPSAASRSSPTSPRCRTCSSPAPPARASRWRSTP
jgi:DNA segregation ATPase FtsK/SpoIIIE-like protein